MKLSPPEALKEGEMMKNYDKTNVTYEATNAQIKKTQNKAHMNAYNSYHWGLTKLAVVGRLLL